MAIVVREADLRADRETLLSILLRNRDQSGNDLRRERFDWSYFHNPYGRPRAWLAIDKSSEKCIGMVGAFPRRMLVNGISILCWNGGDTSFDKQFRTLGPAIKLREAVKSCVERGEMTFLYSYPVDPMRAVLERIGHVTIGRLPMYRLHLRLDQLFDKWMGKCGLSTVLSRSLNPLLLMCPGNLSSRKGRKVHIQVPEYFGSEYDDLFMRVAKKSPVIGTRDAKFLTWRFLQSPLYKAPIIARLEGENQLKGYAVVDITGTTARILDWLVDGNGRSARSLLGGIVNAVRRVGVNVLVLRATQTNPVLRDFRSFGFTACDARNSGIAVYADSFYAPVLSESNWFMTEADRDV
jgi:hypothetical protein